MLLLIGELGIFTAHFKGAFGTLMNFFVCESIDYQSQILQLHKLESIEKLCWSSMRNVFGSPAQFKYKLLRLI